MTSSAPLPNRKNDIFISYSRRDKQFVVKLDQAFRARHRDPWIDWEDIHEGEAWRKAIQRGIECADTFIFVLSPDAASSEECRKELEQAIRLNKRIIPIVYRDATNVHPVLAELNWIFFRDGDNFDVAFTKLLKAIDTDLPHVKTHTRLLSRAIEWEQGRDDGFLLRGKDLGAAEQWLLQAVGKEPLPTELQRKYLTKSRVVEAANTRLAEAGRRARRILGISIMTSGVSLAGAAIAIAVATYQANQRISQLNQQTQALAVQIADQKHEITNLTARQEQLAADRTRLISELKKFGFTDDRIKTLLVSSPDQLQYQLDQVKQANVGYQETVERLKQPEAAPPTPLPNVQPTPTPSSEQGKIVAAPPPAPVPVPDSSPSPAGAEPMTSPPPLPKPADQGEGKAGSANSAQAVRRSRPVTISYLAEDLNPATLDRVFKKLGFAPVAYQAKGATGPANVIYYSQDVRADDVKLVAFTLIRAGLQIRAIQALPETKAETIQVAAVPELQAKPPLDVATIRQQPLPLP
jgi:cell division protein FtsL